MFFETIIMKNTVDLARIQKTIIDTLHKEGKSQRVISERVAVQGVLYQSILNAKLTGGKKLGRKMCTSTGIPSLRIPSSKADSNTWESLQEWTEAGVSASRVTTLRHLQEKATKPLLKQKHHQKHLTWAKEKNNWTVASGPKSSFQMKVNVAFNLEIKVPESGGRVERHRSMLLEVQCEVSTVSDDLGCHVICWCWTFCWQALWRYWFHFPAGLGICPHCQRYQKLVQWPWCYCAWLASKLAWPNPIENLWSIVKRKMRDTRPNNADDLKAAIKATWASLHLSSATLIASMLHWCSNSCKRTPNQVLSA